MNFMTFHILGRIIPTDELIFFRGVGQPPTSIESFLLFYWAYQQLSNMLHLICPGSSFVFYIIILLSGKVGCWNTTFVQRRCICQESHCSTL